MEKSTKIMIGVGIAAVVASIAGFLWWKNKPIGSSDNTKQPTITPEGKPKGAAVASNDTEISDLKSKYTSLNSKMDSLAKSGQGEILSGANKSDGSPEYISIKYDEIPKVRKRLLELGWEAISSQQKDGSWVSSFRPYVKRTFKK